MARKTVALFGEGEKGAMGAPLKISTLTVLNDTLGHPPHESRGIFFAIQFLMYQQEVIFFRVKEEGFSTKDYLQGMHHLQKKDEISQLSALCLPGVGDGRILDAAHPIIQVHGALIVTTERDLYDYLTSLQFPNS